MIALLELIGFLLIAAVFAVVFIVMFFVAVKKYCDGTLTKEELERNSKKVREYFRKRYENWKNSPTWYDRTYGYR